MSLKHEDSVVKSGVFCLSIDANEYEKAVILLGLLMKEGLLDKKTLDRLRRHLGSSYIAYITRTRVWKDSVAVKNDAFEGRRISELKETGVRL